MRLLRILSTLSVMTVLAACANRQPEPLEPPLLNNCIWSSPDGTTAYIGPCNRRANEHLKEPINEDDLPPGPP